MAMAWKGKKLHLSGIKGIRTFVMANKVFTKIIAVQKLAVTILVYDAC